MKKLMIALLFVLFAQSFTSCKKQDLDENAKTHQTVQADDYGDDEDVRDRDDDED